MNVQVHAEMRGKCQSDDFVMMITSALLPQRLRLVPTFRGPCVCILCITPASAQVGRPRHSRALRAFTVQSGQESAIIVRPVMGVRYHWTVWKE